MDKQIFLVGGAVRDFLRGEVPSDKDYVVVGSSVEDMIAAGYKQVGADFPVFLHPETGEEYALARTERKSGEGYKGFVTEIENVTIEDDLRRRDLTINAIASTITNIQHGIVNYIDPFNGRKDLAEGILRHVDDEGFMEDPLRVLRIARFCAKFPSFSVAPETIKLCRLMVLNGDLLHLTPDRVWIETKKALQSSKPSRYFYFLNMIGALEQIFPEIWKLSQVPAGPYIHHPEGDAFIHTMMVLDNATEDNPYSDVARFAALCHDLGKANTDPAILPHHYGHEVGGIKPLNEMCDRLNIPNAYRDTAKVVCKFHTHVHNTNKLNPKTFVKVFEEIYINDEEKFRNIVSILVNVSQADARGRGSFYSNQSYPQAGRFYYALVDQFHIKARDICSEDELKNVNIIKNKMYNARLAAVRESLRPPVVVV